MRTVDTQMQKTLSLLLDGPMAAAKLRDILQISPPTLSRLIARLDSQVIVLGKARATHYARPRDLRGAGHRFPVFQIDHEGNYSNYGEIIALVGDYFCWQSADGQWKIYRDLPWFIQDVKPDGFVGRAFAKRFGPALRFSDHLPDWNNDHALIAVSRFGEDVVGNLVVGEDSLRRYLDTAKLPLATNTPDNYPDLAEAALAGDPAGSSAGGEQPKFTALLDREGTLVPVLVKFSPRISTVEGQRWSDLLVCEHIALKVIQESGHPAANSVVHRIADRYYLEVERFDRTGRLGRLPVNSLGVVDDEYFGHRDNWTAMARRLQHEKMMDINDCATLVWLDIFGELIANTDRHFGNISVVSVNSAQKLFRLAPAYDMLPMFYRPVQNKDLASSVFSPRPIITARPGEFASALECALEFWRRGAADTRISDEFRHICAENSHAILQGPKMV